MHQKLLILYLINNKANFVFLFFLLYFCGFFFFKLKSLVIFLKIGDIIMIIVLGLHFIFSSCILNFETLTVLLLCALRLL
jgi:hypothetical protein